jgi:hypothetical protein
MTKIHKINQGYDMMRLRHDRRKTAACKISGLKDDPYRSIAGELRRMGGFAKDTTPFSEFMWADFMRRRLSKSAVEEDFDKALERAMELAKSEEASYLPGWCGPHMDHVNHAG